MTTKTIDDMLAGKTIEERVSDLEKRDTFYGQIRLGGLCRKCGLAQFEHGGLSCEAAFEKRAARLSESLKPVLNKFKEKLMDQKPSIGRVVIMRHTTEPSNGATDHPAIINRVWSDTMVNLMVFPDCGAAACKTSVKLIDSNSDEKYGWFWPPRV